jgi:hypothetical protein
MAKKLVEEVNNLFKENIALIAEQNYKFNFKGASG